MNKHTEKILLWGGGAVAAYLFLSSNKTALTSLIAPANNPVTQTNPASTYTGDPQHAPVATYAQAVAENPDQTVSSYNLTDSEAYQLMNNYLDLKQAFNNDPNKARNWWHQYGVPEKRIFVPWLTPSTQPFGTGLNVETGKRNEGAASSSGGSWVTPALSIAASVLALLGVNDEPLNPAEKEIIFMGGAIAKDILPMYNTAQAKQAEDKLTAVMISNI